MSPRLYLIALVISVVSINSGCKKDGVFCKKGKGSTVSQDRYETNFSLVKVDMSADLYVAQGSEYKITIEAQSNIQEHIGTEVKNGELRIYEKHCIRKHDPIKVYVTMPAVNGITVDGSGGIYTTSRIETSGLGITIAGSGLFESRDSIIADYCNTTIAGSGSMNVTGRFLAMTNTISGSGDLVLRGKSETNHITVSGSGSIRAFDLPTKTCDVVISGSGNAEVRVSDHLDVTISGSGSLFYKGNPTMSINTSGSGTIIHQP